MKRYLIWCAAIFIAAHLPFLSRSPGDLESINFALGVRVFDVAADQPHAPGYPIFIGAARLTTAALHAAGDADNAAHGLAVVNVIGGALALIAVFALARALNAAPRQALAAAVVFGAVPLVWFTAARPLADLPALAAAVAAQALLVRVSLRGGSMAACAGGALAAAAPGLGPNTVLLTLPLLAVALLRPAGNRWRMRVCVGAGVAVGLAAWITPLVIDAGWGATVDAIAGASRSWVASAATQAASPLLSRTSTLTTLLTTSFVEPFGHILLAALMLMLAAAGLTITLMRDRGAGRMIVFAYLPYLAFHVIAHDPELDRLALPLVVPMALLAVTPLAFLPARMMLAATVGLATAALIIVMPAMTRWVRDEAPGFALMSDLHDTPRVDETVLAMHEGIAADLRRHQAWATIPPMRTLPSPVDYEWYELAKLWQSDYEGPIWFLADPQRTDLRLIDPQSRALLGSYGWNDEEMPYVSGLRPRRIDWYFMQPPGWFLGRGWALTPEIGRVTREAGEAGSAPATAWVRRRPSAVVMALGGRHLGSEGDPPFELSVLVDGVQVDRWPIQPGPFLFMRPLLPEELGEGASYARLDFVATWAAGGPAPVMLEQFDLQSIDGVMGAYDQGWSPPEHDERSGRTWRWTSARSTLWLYNPGRDLTLVLTGRAPSSRQLVVRAGERELARVGVSGAFSEALAVPAEPLSVARGRVTIEIAGADGAVDRSDRPRERGVQIDEVRVY